MFKCKQCGHAFSANIPDKCPECGAENQQPDQLSGGRFLNLMGFVTVGCFAELLVLGIIIGIVVAMVLRYT